MANIMVNSACNLRCPYCFAREFVNRVDEEMTLEDFYTALDFALGDETDRQVGIIGGEPMLYPYINEVIRAAANDNRSRYAVLFTNGVLLERLDDELLAHSKFRLLINCNSREDMGAKSYEKTRRNLLRVKNICGDTEKFIIGVNIYKPGFDYSYLLPLLEECRAEVVRLSVSVPMGGGLADKTPLRHFAEMKPAVVKFVFDMLRRGILPIFDCNFIPVCVFTPREREELRKAKEDARQTFGAKYHPLFWVCAVFTEHSNCSPVIDILPGLKAIRCFGLSRYTKRDIGGFSGIDELKKHYLQTVDMPARDVWADEACAGCDKRRDGRCGGGCLLFKQLYSTQKRGIGVVGFSSTEEE